MLTVPLEEGRGPPNGARFLVADEIQDCTPLQFALIRQWAEEMDEVIVAGDDDQTLFTHLGADPSAFINWPGMEKVHLKQSFRLPAKVHEYSQRWIEKLGDRREPKPFAPRADGYPGRVEHMPHLTARHPEDGIVEVCTEVARSGQTVMVLAANNYQLGRLTSALKSSGVPIHNPYREADGSWNPIKSTVRDANMVVGISLSWSVGRVSALRSLVKSTGVFHNGMATARFCDDKPDGHVLTDEELSTHFVEPQLRPTYDWLSDHAPASKVAGIAYAKAMTDSGLDWRNPCVIPGTIHSVKGGESDVVILLPDLAPSQIDQTALVRLWYVGMTRARSDLLLGGISENNAMRMP